MKTKVSELSQMLHGAGIFTYKTGSSLGGFMVNIPAPSIDDSQKIRDFQLQS
jgi:hypothetical protein